MKLDQAVTQELQVQLELDAHEKLCEERYGHINDKLSILDKRLWRLEAMIMTSTLVVVGVAATLITKL